MMKIATPFLLVSVASAACTNAPTSLPCLYTGAPPTIDADLSDWTSVAGIDTNIYTYSGGEYAKGAASYKCLYDETQIYFAFDIPGDYRFSNTDNHLTAAIGAMFKMGSSATFLDMGGCPEVDTEAKGDSLCASSTPSQCDNYLVDILHWELKTTTQGNPYPIKLDGGSGNDLVANKDDEFAVSSYCRFDDEGADAGNEWAGAWSHSTSDGAGSWRFEVSRLLQTATNSNDIQFSAGQTVDFGVAFWDPFESAVDGWTKPGHFMTGCGTQWIELTLEDKDENANAAHPLPVLGLSTLAVAFGLMA